MAKKEELQAFENMFVSTIGSGSDAGVKGIPICEACKRFCADWPKSIESYVEELGFKTVPELLRQLKTVRVFDAHGAEFVAPVPNTTNKHVFGFVDRKENVDRKEKSFKNRLSAPPPPRIAETENNLEKKSDGGNEGRLTESSQNVNNLHKPGSAVKIQSNICNGRLSSSSRYDGTMDKGKLEKKLEAKDEKNEKIKLEANAEKNEKLKEFQDMLISTIGSGSDVGTKGIPVHEACKRFRTDWPKSIESWVKELGFKTVPELLRQLKAVRIFYNYGTEFVAAVPNTTNKHVFDLIDKTKPKKRRSARLPVHFPSRSYNSTYNSFSASLPPRSRSVMPPTPLFYPPSRPFIPRTPIFSPRSRPVKLYPPCPRSTRQSTPEPTSSSIFTSSMPVVHTHSTNPTTLSTIPISPISTPLPSTVKPSAPTIRPTFIPGTLVDLKKYLGSNSTVNSADGAHKNGINIDYTPGIDCPVTEVTNPNVITNKSATKIKSETEAIIGEIVDASKATTLLEFPSTFSQFRNSEPVGLSNSRSSSFSSIYSNDEDDFPQKAVTKGNDFDVINLTDLLVNINICN